MPEEQTEAERSRKALRGWRRRVDLESWPGVLAIYGLVGAVVCFLRLGATGLVSMEGMVAEGARQMLASGDWLVPRLYGEIYTFKPAMAYWLAALPLALADDPSAGLLRLPFAASGFLMGLAVLLLVGRQAGRRAGLLCAVASVTGVMFLLKGRMAEFDVPLAAGVGVAVAASSVNLTAARPRWGIWLLGYLGLALGFLAKGLPALAVFGPGLLAGALACGRLRRLFGWRHLTAALVFAAIAGAYLWAVWQSAGAAAFEQPLVEARARGFGRLSAEALAAVPEAERFTGGRGWLATVGLSAAKPALIWLVGLPWSILVLYPARRRDEANRLLGPMGRCAAGFLVAATLVFVLTPTHEMRYYLPLAVPWGILCGLIADRLIEVHRSRVRWLLRIASGGELIVASAAVLLAAWFPSARVPPAHRLTLAAAGIAAAAACLHLWRRPGRFGLPLVLASGALCVLLVQVLGFEPYRAARRDQRAEAVQLATHLPAGDTVWVLGPSDVAGKHSSLLYYLDRPVRAFRPGRELPPNGAYCLFTVEDLERLAGTAGIAFRETARVDHDWFSYRLGVCSVSG